MDDLLTSVWAAVTGRTERPDLAVTGPPAVLPAAFDVTGLAAATVGAAVRAAADLLATRTGDTPRDTAVDTRPACAAFAAERLFAPEGWTLPPPWDPVAGDYPAGDGWIRLHTNYAHHRDAALSVLDVAADRDEVARAVAGWSGVELEQAVVDAGGCAAAQHDRDAWLASPPGAATADEPLVRWSTTGTVAAGPTAPAAQPFAGLRVLDLTRVIAGPVCTRFLAGHGADVLRIDPPGFAEVAALVPEMTTGKRTAFLDLRGAGRTRLAELLASADVVVCGLRADALDRLDLGADRLRELNPGLVVARLDAYGWDGPWHRRRGFDSLVQMSSGITSAGAVAYGRDRPTPLPVQALDHATGYVLATAVARALQERHVTGTVREARCSLVATANLLQQHPTPPGTADPAWSAADTERVETAWGPARRAPLPGRIAGCPVRWAHAAGPLGRHRPAWSGPAPDHR